jgi:hypothetical protein
LYYDGPVAVQADDVAAAFDLVDARYTDWARGNIQRLVDVERINIHGFWLPPAMPEIS